MIMANFGTRTYKKIHPTKGEKDVCVDHEIISKFASATLRSPHVYLGFDGIFNYTFSLSNFRQVEGSNPCVCRYTWRITKSGDEKIKDKLSDIEKFLIEDGFTDIT